MDYYILLAILAMLGYGVTAVIYKLAGKSIDPVSMTLMTSAMMTITILLFWLFTKQKNVTFPGLGYAGIAGIIAGLSFIAFIAAIHFGKVSVATTLRGLSFLVTVIIAVLFLAEKLTWLKALGIGFAAIAIVLLTL